MRLRKFPPFIALIALLLITLLSGLPTGQKHLPSLLRSVRADDGLIEPGIEIRSKIAFAQGGEIFTVSPSGHHLNQLTVSAQGTYNYQPALSPDGNRIAFGSYDGHSSGINVMNTDGSGFVRLTTAVVGYDGEPAWSPDGTRLAFVRGADPTAGGITNSITCGSSIYTIDVDHPELGLHNITNGLGGTDPTWSADGNEIAFVSSRYDDNFEVYKYNFSDGNTYRLTNTAENEAEPSWSPDGLRIAYASGYIDEQTKCGFAHTGLGQVALTNGPDIFVMDPDGTNQVRITETGNNFDPVWSPESSSLCFISFENFTTQLFIWDPFHKGPYVITDLPGDKSSPSWSRD
jgi:Tol biopolymer transport system component